MAWTSGVHSQEDGGEDRETYIYFELIACRHSYEAQQSLWISSGWVDASQAARSKK